MTAEMARTCNFPGSDPCARLSTASGPGAMLLLSTLFACASAGYYILIQRVMKRAHA